MIAILLFSSIVNLYLMGQVIDLKHQLDYEVHHMDYVPSHIVPITDKPSKLDGKIVDRLNGGKQ